MKSIWQSLFLLMLGISCSQAAVMEKADNTACFRCHSMTTLAYIDLETGGIVDLSVQAEIFRRSNHGKLSCKACHQAAVFDKYPHTIHIDIKKSSCEDCHEDHPGFQKKYRFEKIVVQFQKSVHYQSNSDKFDCYSCHDPHSFWAGLREENTTALVRQDNRMCLNCHETPSAGVRKKARTSLEIKHQWLPNMRTHFDSVRCVDCHVAAPGSVVHAIEPARRAEKRCVSCHTRDSMLLSRLYRYHVHQERQKGGFFNSVVLNDAYIIGMTRNRFIDWFSLLLTGATLIGITAHGIGRWISSRRS
ncbi:MAG: nitrate reductase [Gammaproteobacteria bacterium]|nr:nitrate reductase [Gammaproteobacteria bacterium]